MTRHPLRLAHRGDWRRAPENTLPALLAALEAPGCDGLEFDVRAAADGTPVLLHDRTLWRVQRRVGWVHRMMPEELRATGIPTLAEVLEALPASVFLDVELKDDPGPGAVAVLAAARGPGLANAVVSSFVPATLAAVRAARPDWPLWLNAHHLTPERLAEATRVGCQGIALERHAIDADAIGRAADAGLEVAAFTVRDAATLARLARLGVVAACVEDAVLDG